MNKVKEWLLSKVEQVKKLKKDQLLIILLSGVLLLVIALPVDKIKTKNGQDAERDYLEEIFEPNDTDSAGGQAEEEENQETFGENYAREMESKLKEVLSSMDQVGKVEVLITLKTSEEKIVEKDLPVTRSNSEEVDAEGGRRNVNNMDSGENTIYETDSGKSTPYVIKTTSPLVEGVVVVCEGEGIGTVNKDITEAVQALFGIEAHKIKVVRMKR